MNKLQIELGNNLRRYRKEAKLSQSEVGKKLNLTSQAVANYENGKRDVSSSMLLKFAELYNIPVARILGAPENDKLPDSFWQNLIEKNAELDEKLNKDFDIHIVGNIPQSAYNEIMSFIDYIKYKYGYPKK